MAERFTKAEKKRIKEILERLSIEFPDVTCALVHKDPFQLLVATILSAQCTDIRVNMVTPALFQKFPGPLEMSQASLQELEELIRSTGFFRNKAKNLLAASNRLVMAFDSQVPDKMEQLISLPGVARKTANVVLGTWFGIPSGVVVDTHVKRISNRLGLTVSDNPIQIEKDLMEKVPRDSWIDFSHRVIHHGRQTCKARKPLCRSCVLLDICPAGQEGLLGVRS